MKKLIEKTALFN